MNLDGVFAGEMKLALEVSLGDLHVAHGHADAFVSQQIHEGRKADVEADHFRGIGVAEAVGSNVIGATRLLCGLL